MKKGSYIFVRMPQATPLCLAANKRIIYPIDSPTPQRLLSTWGVSCRGFTYLYDILLVLKYGRQLKAFIYW